MPDATSVALTTRAKPRLRHAGFHPVVLILLSAIATVCGCLASRGNGWPPFTYVLTGGIIVPLIADWTAQRVRSARAISLAFIAFGGVATFGIAYRTSRPPADEVFHELFDATVPSHVRDLRTRVQWFDGRMVFATFVTDERTFEALVSGAELRSEAIKQTEPESPEQLELRWFRTVGMWAGPAYHFWPTSKQVPSLDTRQRTGDSSRPWITTVARDPATGEVWAIRLYD